MLNLELKEEIDGPLEPIGEDLDEPLEKPLDFSDAAYDDWLYDWMESMWELVASGAGSDGWEGGMGGMGRAMGVERSGRLALRG